MPHLSRAPSMQPLDTGVKIVWRIKAALVWSVILIAVFAGDVLSIPWPPRSVPFGVLTGGALLLGITWSLVIPPLRYRFWRYELRAEELYLERGIWNRVQTIVPLRRIQHLDVSQDIIERNYALGRLIVHTAGTSSSDVVLPGLHFEEAERLRDEVKHSITEYAV